MRVIIRNESDLRTKAELRVRAHLLIDRRGRIRKEAALMRRRLHRSRLTGWQRRLLQGELAWALTEVRELPVLADELMVRADGLPFPELQDLLDHREGVESGVPR